jgi:hypothetical protein
VRGPRLARRFLSAKDTCKPNEITMNTFMPEGTIPAVTPVALEATTEGTLISIGTLCEKRGPAAEVWDSKTGTSRIVDLTPWWKKIGYWPQLLKGSGDELWLFADGFHPVLHYHDGKFDPAPDLLWPIQKIFASPSGQLYASTDRTIFRLDAASNTWIAVGRFAKPQDFRTVAVSVEKDSKEGSSFWAAASPGTVYKLREGPRVPVEEPCDSWFVYLYAVSDTNDRSYTFPTTRKALTTFPEASDLRLVEIDAPRRLGVTVVSKTQGEAVIAHVKANMKDEDPKLYCYRPKDPRKIDLTATAK